MRFAPQRRAIVHLSSGQVAPHPPLWRAYFSTLRSHKSLENNRCFENFLPFSRTCIFFLLTLSLLWSSLFFSSLTLPTSPFPSVHIVRSLTTSFDYMILYAMVRTCDEWVWSCRHCSSNWLNFRCRSRLDNWCSCHSNVRFLELGELGTWIFGFV